MKRSSFLFAILFIAVIFGSQFFCFAAEEIVATYNSNMRRDPLMPLVDSNGVLIRVTVTQSATEMHLQGIAYSSSPKDRLVILDGEVYQLNDVVGGYKIVSIEEFKVILRKDDEDFVLELQREEEE